MSKSSTDIPLYQLCQIIGHNSQSSEVLVFKMEERGGSYPQYPTPHRHDFHQIVFLLEGTGNHVMDFVVYPLQAPQVFFVSKSMVHTLQFETAAKGYVINFEDAFISAVCHNPRFIYELPILNLQIGQPVLPLDAAQAEILTAHFESLIKESIVQDVYHQDMLRGLLMQLLMQLSRWYPQAPINEKSNAANAMVYRFEMMVDQHFHEWKLPKQYAERLFVTPNYLNAICKSEKGVSAGDIIRDRIVLEAKRLLVNSSMSISEIAFRLNFTDNAYFSRFFKKYTQQSPDQFRQSL